MKLLVTGAQGFTGQHFVKHAQLQNYDVVSLKSNLTNRVGLQQEITRIMPDFVVHLAAISFVGHTDLNAFYAINVIGTLNLLDALLTLEKPPQRILLASSANVYGNCENSPILETQIPAPINHYAMSKLAMEYLSKTYLDRLPIFWVRPFNYTGVGQGENFIIPKLVKHFALKAKTIEIGNIDIEREFNDVRFVCDVYLQLLSKSLIGEVYNICTNQPVALKSVIQLLTDLTEHDLNIKVNPAFVRHNEIHRLCGCPEKLKKNIDPIAISSLADTLEWMLKNQ